MLVHFTRLVAVGGNPTIGPQLNARAAPTETLHHASTVEHAKPIFDSGAFTVLCPILVGRATAPACETADHMVLNSIG
jgi:hypothetical protein